MKQIPLTQGKFALVDDEDFDWLNQWKWYFGKHYAVRTEYYSNGNRRQKTIYMHCFILGTSDGMETDHRDLNKLNNQRYNLRNATNLQNRLNKDNYHGSFSRFKGVSWHKVDRHWQALIQFNNKRTFLGYFPSEEAAAKAYNDAAIKLHGEFARLNEIVA